MLHFLQPLFLFGLSLIAVPLILHFFTRQRFTDIPFPSLLLLRRSRRRTLPTFTLHHLLILLCRILGVAFLTLIFAMPLVRGKLWGAGESRSMSALYLIIDNSLSTRWHTRSVSTYDKIKEAAKEILQNTSDKEEIYLSFACGQKRGGHFSSAASSIDDIIALVRKSAPDFCGGNLRTQTSRAIRILARSSAPERKLVIISDLQRRAFNFPPLPQPDFPLSLVIVDASGGAKRDNLALGPSPLPISPLEGESVPLCFDVRGSAQKQTLATSLTLGSEKRGERSVQIKPGGKTTSCFHLSFPAPGVQFGSISLTPDSLETDNHWFFRFTVGSPQRVALLASKEDLENPAADAFYLIRAFRAAANAGAGFQSINAEVFAPSELHQFALKNFNMAILTSGTPLTLKDMKQLHDFTSNGGGLLIFAGDDNTINKMIAEVLFAGKIHLMPQQIEPERKGKKTQLYYQPVETIDLQHPFFSSAEIKTSDVLDMRFAAGARLKVGAPEVKVLMSIAENRPVLVEHRIGQGAVMLLASGLSPYRTNFALQPIFVPWLLRACKYASGRQDEPPRDFIYGQEVRIAFQERIDEKQLRIRNLRSNKSFSIYSSPASSKIFTLPGATPLPPGVYAVEQGDSKPPLDVITINIDQDEGDLDAISQKALAKKFSGLPFRIIKIKGTLWRGHLADAVFKREFTPLLPIFLIAAFSALLLDTLFSNRK
ncbi:MAG: BatA domain-containing protein [bacterium]